MHFASTACINSGVYVMGGFSHLVVFPQKVAPTDRSEQYIEYCEVMR